MENQNNTIFSIMKEASTEALFMEYILVQLQAFTFHRLAYGYVHNPLCKWFCILI